MIFLTAIVFIAELIILYSIVCFLIQTDRKVCLLAESVSKRQTKLKWRMKALQDITSGLNEIFPILVKKANKTRRNMLIRLTNEFLQGIILLLFKPKYKKILLGAKAGIEMIKKSLKV